MLVLTRKEGEVILVGDNIRITLVRSTNGQAKIGIDAPDTVTILRDELTHESTKDNDGRGNI